MTSMMLRPRAFMDAALASRSSSRGSNGVVMPASRCALPGWRKKYPYAHMGILDAFRVMQLHLNSNFYSYLCTVPNYARLDLDLFTPTDLSEGPLKGQYA